MKHIVCRLTLAVAVMAALHAHADTTNVVAQFDFNDGGTSGSPTQAGFQGISMTGGVHNGITLAISGVSDDRDRGEINGANGHAYAQVLRDLTHNNTLLTLDLSGLTADDLYHITIFSFDPSYNRPLHYWYQDSTNDLLLATTSHDMNDGDTGFFTISNMLASATGTLRVICPPSGNNRCFNGMIVEQIVHTGPDIHVLGGSGLYRISDGSAEWQLANGTHIGLTELGESQVKNYVITNVGVSALDLTGTPLVDISGSPTFSVTAQPGTDPVPAGGSTTFEVTYTPSAIGVDSAIISIDNDDPDEDPFTFTVWGTCVDMRNPVAAFDLNNNGFDGSVTMKGFQGVSTIGGAQNGISLAIGGVGATRDRQENSGDIVGHPYADVLRDMSHSNPDITLDLSGLLANRPYDILIYSYDADHTRPTAHNWYEDTTNGALLQTISPNVSDAETGYFVVSNIFSSVSGTIRIVGTRIGTPRHFNGLVVGELDPQLGTLFSFR